MRAELLHELRPDAARVGDDEPTNRRSTVNRFNGSPGREHHLSGEVTVAGQDCDIVEAGGGQELLPAPLIQQRMVGAEVGVGEAPPALGEAKGDVHPGAGPRALDEEQHTAGCQQITSVCDRLADVGGGVEDVGCDHDVEVTGYEALCGGISLDVECSAANARARRRIAPRPPR